MPLVYENQDLEPRNTRNTRKKKKLHTKRFFIRVTRPFVTFVIKMAFDLMAGARINHECHKWTNNTNEKKVASFAVFIISLCISKASTLRVN
jgi:hypothetical protein